MPLAVLSGALDKFQKALIAASGLAMPTSRLSPHAFPGFAQPAFPRRFFSPPSTPWHCLVLFPAGAGALAACCVCGLVE